MGTTGVIWCFSFIIASACTILIPPPATTVQRSHIYRAAFPYGGSVPRYLGSHSIRADPQYTKTFCFWCCLVDVPCAFSLDIKKGANAPIFLFSGILGASGGYFPLRGDSSMISWSIMPCLMARSSVCCLRLLDAITCFTKFSCGLMTYRTSMTLRPSLIWFAS